MCMVVLIFCSLLFYSNIFYSILFSPVVSQALVPITQDVEVSYELHRYIIGQKGSGIRKMMEEYEVRKPPAPPAGGVVACTQELMVCLGVR